MKFQTLVRKSVTATLLCLVILVSAAAIAVFNIVNSRNGVAHLVDTTLNQVAAVGEFNVAMTRAIGEAKLYRLSGEASELEQAETALALAEQALARLNPNAAAEDEFNDPTYEKSILLYQERRALFDTTHGMIDQIAAADTAERQELAEALEDEEGNLDRINDEAMQMVAGEGKNVSQVAIDQISRSVASVVAVLLLSVLMPLSVLWLLGRYLIKPIKELSFATEAVIAGRMEQVLPITGNDEIALLQRNFNTMLATIGQQTQALEDQVETATKAQATAEQASSELAAQLATVEAQRTIIREMSVPILPLSDSTLVMPLIGALDQERLEMVQSTALRAVERSRARFLLLDITGLPIIDTHVAHGLLQVVSSARLLGAKAILVGIRPEVAQTIVSLGINLEHVPTRSSLQEGVAATN